MNFSEFIESIEGCQCERNEAIRAAFMHSPGRLIVESGIGDISGLQFHPDSTLAAGDALVHSFAPEFRVLFGESLGKIWIALRATNHCLPISKQQILLLQTAPKADF